MRGSSPLTRGKQHRPSRCLARLGLIPAHAGKTPAHRRKQPRVWAHPRSRGENRRLNRLVAHTPGSSPLTRGKPGVRGLSYAALGLIPAHAGKTGPFGLVCFLVPAHPRSRGENYVGPLAGGEDRGSSPLTRGKRTNKLLPRRPKRLIPAHAGKTRPHRPGHRTPDGSSPLTRGKPRGRAQPRRGNRLIPAHAGKTRGIRRWERLRRAHPRSRGENSITRPIRGAARGSSPLTRGKRRSYPGWRGHSGLIPAHAGKTMRSMRRCSPPSAHPRSRGENHVTRTQRHATPGSSPLTRGKLRVSMVGPFGLGLIPAHAGKTGYPSLIAACLAAHPRSRGENHIVCVAQATPRGSSPLTRGKPHSVPCLVDSFGLIPAHAGKTIGDGGQHRCFPAHPRSRGENLDGCHQYCHPSGSSPLTRGKLSTP